MAGINVRQLRYHLIFWSVYILLWGARDLIYHPSYWSNVSLNFIFSLFVAPFVYFNIYYLVPRFLLQKKAGQFILYFSVVFIAALLTRYSVYQFIFNAIGALDSARRFSSGDGIVIVASENAILFMISMALYIIKKYYVKEKYAHELEQKNMASELSMLKAQLQPHFLFNNLNTIYFLMETNPALAKEVMIRFTDVLSHQLYNAQKDKVSLKEELDSLESFLKIQALRHEDFLDLKYAFPSNIGQWQIAPMILLTFVENAFKHSQREEGYSIEIEAELQEANLQLRVVNSIGQQQRVNGGGVGLENVKRRLSLLYPNRHALHIKSTAESYTVDLTLTLEPNGQA